MPDPAMSGSIPSRIAVTVIASGTGWALCPFFGKCDGILVFDAGTRQQAFLPNPARTAESLCALILSSEVGGLICGFIAEADSRRLRAKGIDVRAGSGRVSVAELAAGICTLPKA